MKADCRWKKSGLVVHFNIMKDTLSQYNNMVKEARANSFSNLISAQQHNPCVLFKIVDMLVNPNPPRVPAETDADCEMFLSYFTDKVVSIRKSIIPNSTIPEISLPQHDTLDRLFPITFAEPLETPHMRVTSSHLDVIPTKFFYQK